MRSADRFRPEGGVELVDTGRFDDRLVLDGSLWRIASRWVSQGDGQWLGAAGFANATDNE